MSLTLEEIKERLLKLYDPDDLLEALQISAQEILDRFEDKLIRRLDSFQEEIEEELEDYEY
jgi:adenylate kinase family enzyme